MLKTRYNKPNVSYDTIRQNKTLDKYMIKQKRVCRFHEVKGLPMETTMEKAQEFCPKCKKEGVNYGIKIIIVSED